MKNLKVSVISICFGFIFLLINGTTDLYAYHDLGPFHLDTGLVACIHATNNKSKTLPVLTEPIFSLIIPDTAPRTDLHSTEETYPPAFVYFGQFPSRASPAFS